MWLWRKDNKRSAELMYKGIENITICDHPLIKHKLSIIRQKTTGTNEFRTIVEELSMMIGYEALPI